LDGWTVGRIFLKIFFKILSLIFSLFYSGGTGDFHIGKRKKERGKREKEYLRERGKRKAVRTRIRIPDAARLVTERKKRIVSVW